MEKARPSYEPEPPRSLPAQRNGDTPSPNMIGNGNGWSRLSVDPISRSDPDSAPDDAATVDEIARAHRVAQRSGGTVVRMGPLRRRNAGQKRGSRFRNVVLAKVGNHATARGGVREEHNYRRLHTAGLGPRVIWAGARVVVVSGIARTLDATIRAQKGELTAGQQTALVNICTAPDTYLHAAHLRYVGHVVVSPSMAGNGAPELVLIHPVGVSVYPSAPRKRSVGVSIIDAVRNLLVPGTTDILDAATWGAPARTGVKLSKASGA